MQFTGKISDVSIDFNTNKPKITFLINEKSALEQLDDIKSVEKLAVEAKKWRKKRSLNANNYAWELITQIANVLRANKDDIYVEMLKRYGQIQTISVLEEIDVSKFLKYYDESGKTVLNGKNFKHYKVYTGSSEMDTKQMSILIDGIVSEAKDLKIETMTPNEIARLKERWDNNETQKNKSL